MAIEFQTNFFSPGEVYVGLSRVKKSDDALLIHKAEDDSLNAIIYHQMSSVNKKPVIREAVRFAIVRYITYDLFQVK